MSKQSKILSIIAALWLSCLALPAGAVSLGNTGADLWVFEYDRGTSTTITDITNSSTSTAVSYNVPRSTLNSYSDTAAYAGPNGLKNMALARNDREARSNTSLGDTYTVSSTYATGTAVTLNFGLRLNGILDLSTYLQGGNSSIDVSGGFILQDPTIGVEGEGFIITPLVEFNTSIYYNESHSTYWGETYTDYSASWSLLQNDIQVDGDSISDFRTLADNQTIQCLSTSAPCDDRLFDTGVLALSVDTYVGAELQWLADLSILAQTLGPDTYTFADFGNSFDLLLTSSDPNVWLDGTFSLDSTVVPIPAAVWLFGSGLVGLIVIGRRKTSLT